MAEPDDLSPPQQSGVTQAEQLPASSICQKINEMVEDFQNGHISEARLAEMLTELHMQDDEHFLDKIDEYNKELRKKLEKIAIAKAALEAANAMVHISESLQKHPDVDHQQANKLTKAINEKLLTVKNLGDAKEVSDALDDAIKDVDNATKNIEKTSTNKTASDQIQKHLNDLKEITMGVKADYLGSTRLSMGTGQVMQGPLGEIVGLGFDKLQVEADNDTSKYISGYISNAKKDLAGGLKSTANQAYNPRMQNRPG